jgi:hypothetical protein
MKIGLLSNAHFLMFVERCELLGGHHRTTERDQAMKKTLLALATAAAILSGSGLAGAEATKPTLAPFGSPTNAAKIEQPQASTRVALTDDQMGKVTAGHYDGFWHNGWFYLLSSLDTWWNVWGWHKYEYHY